MNETNGRTNKVEVNRTALFALDKLSLLGIAINAYEALNSVRDIPQSVGEDNESIIEWVDKLDEKQKAAWLNIVEATSEAYKACRALLDDYGIPMKFVEEMSEARKACRVLLDDYGIPMKFVEERVQQKIIGKY